MQSFQRPLGPGWKPKYQQKEFFCLAWNNGIGSPMEEHQRQMQQWQFVGAAMDLTGNPRSNGFQGKDTGPGIAR